MRRLLRVCVLLTAIVFSTEVMVLAAARLNYHDPFAPYSPIVPGQPADAVKEYPCSLLFGMSNGVEVGYCQFEVVDSVFSKVRVIVSDRIITRTEFVVQPNRLRVGDLILCRGEPLYIERGDRIDETPFVNIFWVNQMSARASVEQHGAQLEHLLPVNSISIEHLWRPIERDALSCASGQ